MNTQNPLPETPFAAPSLASNGTYASPQAESPSFENALPPRAAINIDFFDFFTLSMLGIIGSVLAVIAFAYDMVSHTFLHHIELNGIIGAITVYGIYRVYSNNFSLYRTARYVKRIQDMEQNPSATEATIASLIAGLKGAGSMLDIQNTEMALRRMLKSGFFVITDNDSRLIKSKIGSRVRYRYNHISFFAGILISFGLLGTFVGLIATVASVGEQMGTISRSLASGQEMNVIDLIVGISKPMEGMGTAFGASLFGLGGSMLLGGLNHVAGHAQDHFMENLSRWLDDRIPSVKGATAEKAAEKMGTSAASITGKSMSLEAGTFMVLAEDTHKQLRAIGGMMSELTRILEGQQNSTRALQQMHEQHTRQMQNLESQLAQIPAIGQQLMQVVGSWQNNATRQQEALTQHQESHTKQLTQVLGNLAVLPGTGEKLGAELREWRSAYNQQTEQQKSQNDKLTAQVQSLAQAMQGVSLAVSSLPVTTPTNGSVVAAVPKSSGGWFGSRKS
ncbi:MAG: hypothetical protein DI585_00015 [Pseudomonas fluorescens]|nr:MAG: hypothetical protein DI585_00015 [Pseudomonas fluorescens]